ncbi:MmgE/PrpD family protein [Cupriavidus lacunae]|uniref:MmgE/PrpD family protein n=1 Tax=Cupriavidus lacunae TaxID=2666307 RepID=A0A370NLR8_9BURK|nr:MmgE/PrpD family protein [Cupriavidus lacunae]RDK06521.1 MmgE/PrpD family protein [Cupriavidus lacunae]
MDATTLRIARHVAAAEFRRLPEQAIHECRRRIIDSVACAAAAYREPFCATIRTFAARYAGTPAARMWGSGERTSIEMAAFANGTMLRYQDYSDTHLGKSNGHPSDMIGGLVALAEAFHLGGEDLVTAIVVAYEVYCSLCDSTALASRGIDQGTCAAAGSAAGAARLLGLGETQAGEAISLALSSSLQLYNVRTGDLSDWKGCAGPNGARNGVFAALLAREGVTGPSAVVEGKGGLRDVAGELDWRVGAGEMPLIVGTHLKFHPVCYHGQAAVDAALTLRDRISGEDIVAIESIEAIEVQTYEAALRAMGGDPTRWAPTNRETADHSLPYTIAVALLNGRLVSADYERERLADPRTLRLMERIRVGCSAELTNAFPAHSRSRIAIRLKDGTTYSHLQNDPKGSAANPLTDAELESKFLELYRPWSDGPAARRTLDLLWSVDQLASVAQLVDAFCHAPDA